MRKIALKILKIKNFPQQKLFENIHIEFLTSFFLIVIFIKTMSMKA